MPVVNDVELRYKWLQKKTFEYHNVFFDNYDNRRTINHENNRPIAKDLSLSARAKHLEANLPDQIL